MTAVDYLVQQIETGKIEIVYSDKIHSIRCLPEFVKQAIEMEKQQIKDSYDAGYKDGNAIPGYDYFDDSESYYEKTYKK